MTVERQYLLWLQDMVDPSHSFGLLIESLYSMAYEWDIKIDENLEWLGMGLREQFMKECDVCDMSGMAIVLVHPCSIIEVLCSIAQDIELFVLGYADAGRNTALRWYDILAFLELSFQFDECFDREFVEEKMKNLTKKMKKRGFTFSFHEFIYDQYFC